MVYIYINLRWLRDHFRKPPKNWLLCQVTSRSQVVTKRFTRRKPFSCGKKQNCHHLRGSLYYRCIGRTCLVAPMQLNTNVIRGLEKRAQLLWNVRDFCELCTTAGKRAQHLWNVHNISETCTYRILENTEWGRWNTLYPIINIKYVLSVPLSLSYTLTYTLSLSWYLIVKYHVLSDNNW